MILISIVCWCYSIILRVYRHARNVSSSVKLEKDWRHSHKMCHFIPLIAELTTLWFCVLIRETHRHACGGGGRRLTAVALSANPDDARRAIRDTKTPGHRWQRNARCRIKHADTCKFVIRLYGYVVIVIYEINIYLIGGMNF